jgi:hypothetical protein
VIGGRAASGTSGSRDSDGSSWESECLRGEWGSRSPPVTGSGVYGATVDNVASSRGIWDESSHGIGVYGVSDGAQRAVLGYRTADTPGVQGHSLTGRGSVSKVPCTATARFNTYRRESIIGRAGDLYVDKNKRLWLCKGGMTGKHIA